jgi:hypothetical protein
VILHVVFSCDAILNDCGDILQDLLRLNFAEVDLTCDKRDVQILIQLVSQNRPKFTASRFFSINRSTIFQVINSMITFLVVCVQFKS